MRSLTRCLVAVAAPVLVAGSASSLSAQSTDLSSAMHWREIGPTRAGRARALAGVPSQPNVFYIGFDNGGVWRSTDYGSTWVPLFDRRAHRLHRRDRRRAVRPEHHLRRQRRRHHPPRSRHGQRHLQVHRRRQDVDAPRTARQPDDRDHRRRPEAIPNRLFVAALGHPYGPNAERGIFRSTDGGKTFQKVLYKDEYTSAQRRAHRSERSEHRVRGALAAAAELHRGRMRSAARPAASSSPPTAARRGSSSTDGLAAGAAGESRDRAEQPEGVYAMVAARAVRREAAARGGTAAESSGFYKSTDAGEHWDLAVNDRPAITARTRARSAARSCASAAAICRRSPSIRRTRTSSTARRPCSGAPRTAASRGPPCAARRAATTIRRRGSTRTIRTSSSLVADQGGVVSANRGASWSNWYTQPTAAMYHVSTDNTFPYRVCGGQQDSGSACVDSRSMDGEITFHDWHPGEHPGVRHRRARSAAIPTWCSAACARTCRCTIGRRGRRRTSAPT